MRGRVPVNEFQTVEIPETTLIETEGAPAIPNKDGVFVAIPTDAEDVQIRTVDKSFYSIDHDLRILPAPKQFTEEEFQEVYEPDSAIYESDEPYPGRDFDFLGIKQIAGIKVVHILAYLGQYKPMSRRLDLIQSLVLEVSYRTPPATDRSPGRKPREIPESDLILGLDLLDKRADFSSGIEDFEGMDREFVDDLEADADPLTGTLQNSLPSSLTAGKLGPVQR